MAAAGHSAAIVPNAGGGIGGRMIITRTALRTIWIRSHGICIARNDGRASHSEAFRMASLQENRTVLTYLHPVSFFAARLALSAK